MKRVTLSSILFIHRVYFVLCQLPKIGVYLPSSQTQPSLCRMCLQCCSHWRTGMDCPLFSYHLQRGTTSRHGTSVSRRRRMWLRRTMYKLAAGPAGSTWLSGCTSVMSRGQWRQWGITGKLQEVREAWGLQVTACVHYIQLFKCAH